MWDDDRIDAAIDEAARQMTAGEPGADFRVRVMERIDRRPRVTRLWRPAFAALSVAAAIVIAVLVLRDRPRPEEVRLPPSPLRGYGVPRKPDATTEKPAAPPAVAQDFSPAIRKVRLPPSPLRRYGVPGKADSPFGLNSDVEPLTTPPLEIESIAVAALAGGDVIHIDPMPSAAPIAVPPLGVDNEGDRR